MYQRALAINEKALGIEHPYVATNLNNIALVYHAQGNHDEAISFHQRALTLREKVLGQEHPDVAQSLNNIALLYRVRRSYDKALVLHQRALAINEKALGREHITTASIFLGLGMLYYELENYPHAIKSIYSGAEIEEKNLVLNLAAGTEAQKRAYLTTFFDSTNGIVSLHIKQATNNLQAARIALATILRRKGRVLDSVADTYSILRERLQPEDDRLLDRLASTHSQLQTLELKGLSDTSPEIYRQQLIALRTQAEELETKLARRSAEFRNQSQTATIEAVQQNIPSDAALVELIRYRPFNPKATKDDEEWGKSRYAVYVLSSQGKPQWKDLGEAATIDRLVNEFRRQLLTPPPTDSPGLVTRATRKT